MDDPRSRALKLAEIRRQIYEGTYETPGRLALAVERFLERHELGGGAAAGESLLD
jgi:hypothetical protein